MSRSGPAGSGGRRLARSRSAPDRLSVRSFCSSCLFRPLSHHPQSHVRQSRQENACLPSRAAGRASIRFGEFRGLTAARAGGIRGCPCLRRGIEAAHREGRSGWLIPNKERLHCEAVADGVRCDAVSHARRGDTRCRDNELRQWMPCVTLSGFADESDARVLCSLAQQSACLRCVPPYVSGNRTSASKRAAGIRPPTCPRQWCTGRC